MHFHAVWWLMKVFDPEAKPGLSAAHFRKICENGLGDGNNSYAHSMAWLEDYLYLGTFRSIFVGMRVAQQKISIDQWPVPVFPPYSPEFERASRPEIWRYHIPSQHWERLYQAPIVTSEDHPEGYSRELGYRGMVAFQGKSDLKPVIYASTFSRPLGPGPLILRCEDGKAFFPVGRPGLVGLPVNSLRCMIVFKDRLFTAPTGAPKGNPNTSLVTVVYESSDPAKGDWHPINEPGFGDPGNRTIFEIASFGDYLYAGTLNNKGFQIWRSRVEGKPPYQWEKVIEGGAERGSLNQAVASMVAFKGALYVGSAIQGGGYDPVNNIGPAGSEIIRVHPDGSWDLMVGDARKGRKPLSGLSAGFNSAFNGYLWKMGAYNGWLYAGTLNWSTMLRFTNIQSRQGRVPRLFDSVGAENVVSQEGGFDLWRTHDGENWLPVTRRGFGNPYNYGVRNIVPTSYGLFIGTANPFGPKVATQVDGEWIYTDNPDGGLEIWHGNLDSA